MRVVVVGAQSVGKTTLLENLRPEYKQLVIKEAIREAAKADPSIKTNENGDERSQMIFFEMYERMLGEQTNYISDRGLVDVCAYTKWLCKYGTNFPKINLGVYFNMFNRLVEFTRRNPDVAYVYIPIKFDAVEDGFRSTNEKYRHQVDEEIREVFAKLNNATQPRGICPYHELKAITLEDRVKELEDFIEDLKWKDSTIKQ